MRFASKGTSFDAGIYLTRLLERPSEESSRPPTADMEARKHSSIPGRS
jgi:hypothetical protein